MPEDQVEDQEGKGKRKEELQAILNSAQTDFNAIAQRGLDDIDFQLSFFYLSDLELSDDVQKDVDKQIKEHLDDHEGGALNENEKTFYRDFILQATFIHEYYSKELSEEQKADLKKEMSLLREALNGKPIADLKMQFKEVVIKLSSKELNDDAKGKLKEVNEEFEKRKDLFETVFLRGDQYPQDPKEKILYMKTKVPLGKILDYGGTSEVFQPIEFPAEFGTNTTIGGMRCNAMNALSVRLATLDQAANNNKVYPQQMIFRVGAERSSRRSVHKVHDCGENREGNNPENSAVKGILSIFKTCYTLQGELNNLRGTFQNSLKHLEEEDFDLEDFDSILRENIVSNLSKSIALEGQVSGSLTGKMQKNLDDFNKFYSNSAQSELSGHDEIEGFYATSNQSELSGVRKFITQSFEKLINTSIGVVAGFLERSAATSRQKQQMELLVDDLAENFDKLKVSKDTSLERIKDLNGKLKIMQKRMERGIDPFSEKLHSRISVLEYEMETWMVQKQRALRREASRQVPLETDSPKKSLTRLFELSLRGNVRELLHGTGKNGQGKKRLAGTPKKKT
ncbi:MAG: hypothetical protein U1E78_01045 [Gammaproteobacteria bacterium]